MLCQAPAGEVHRRSNRKEAEHDTKHRSDNDTGLTGGTPGMARIRGNEVASRLFKGAGSVLLGFEGCEVAAASASRARVEPHNLNGYVLKPEMTHTDSLFRARTVREYTTLGSSGTRNRIASVVFLGSVCQAKGSRSSRTAVLSYQAGCGSNRNVHRGINWMVGWRICWVQAEFVPDGPCTRRSAVPGGTS